MKKMHTVKLGYTYLAFEKPEKAIELCGILQHATLINNHCINIHGEYREFVAENTSEIKEVIFSKADIFESKEEFIASVPVPKKEEYEEKSANKKEEIDIEDVPF